MNLKNDNFLPRIITGGSGSGENKDLNWKIYDFFVKNMSIPLYQRYYSWTRNEIWTFLKDIKTKFINNEGIWLGVVYLHADPANVFHIIDGQQRIITMEKIFKVFLNDFSSKKIKRQSSEFKFYEANDESYPSNLKKLKTYVEKFKKEEIEFKNKEKFSTFLKEKVFCTVLSLQNDYEYFENLNSKGIKLVLTNQCMGFLSSNKIEEVTKNCEVFKWLLLKRKKNIYEPFIKSDDFFERFILIYCDSKNKNTHFSYFKKWILNKTQNWEIFLQFLIETKKLFEKKDERFYTTYLKKICFSDYWIIYVVLQLKKSNFLGRFLETIWKFDLIRHLNGIAKNSIKSEIISLVKKIISIREKKYWKEYCKTLLFITNKNFIPNKLSFDLKANRIGKKNPPNFSSRLKVFLYLLYCEPKKDLNKIRLKNFLSLNMNIEHLVSLNNVVYKGWFEKDLNEINLLKNLCILDKNQNENLGCKDIEKKFTIISKYPEASNEFKPFLNECISDWKEIKKFGTKKEKIKFFWERREEKLNKKIKKFKEEILNLDLFF